MPHTEPLLNKYWSRSILSVMGKRTQKLASSMKTLSQAHWFLLILLAFAQEKPGMGCCLATACGALFYQPMEMLSLDLMPFSTHGFVNDEYPLGTFLPFLQMSA